MSAVNVVQTVDVKELMDKIKSKGYWRVNIRPTKFDKSQIESPSRCWELVESNKVSLRGWDYPYVGQKERVDGEDSIQSGFDLDRFGHREFWRFYQSGQFIHYFACKEDYRMPDRIGRDSSRGMSILSTLYSVTEIFEFAARLAQKEVLKPKLQISIKLVGMEGRELFFWSANRDLRFPYICDKGEMSFNEELSLTEIMAEGHNKALDITVRILETFNWQNPSRSVLAEDQQRFLQKRL